MLIDKLILELHVKCQMEGGLSNNEINDISFIQFNNVNNEDVLDVDSGIIENIGTQKINLRVYKYFIIDFKRFVTINEVSIYDQSYNIIPYTLWTRSKENGDEDAIFDTSSEQVTSMAFNHLKKVVNRIMLTFSTRTKSRKWWKVKRLGEKDAIINIHADGVNTAPKEIITSLGDALELVANSRDMQAYQQTLINQADIVQ